MPNRIIKESIHTSESVNQMTDFQFRLWVNLITYVDDFGRGDARPAVIRGACFPLRDRLTNRDIEAALKALAGIGCVGLYEVDGKPYLYFPTWASHQSIRNQKSKYPAPESNCKQLKSIGINCPRNPIQSESESESEAGEKRARARFAPPTAEEVQAYAGERGYEGFSTERFIAYYESNGWKVGRNPMKDWRAAVRNWASRDMEPSPNRSKPKNPALEYEQRTYTDSDFDGMFVDLDHYEDGTSA